MNDKPYRRFLYVDLQPLGLHLINRRFSPFGNTSTSSFVITFIIPAEITWLKKMTESSAADLLQQMKDFMQNAGSHEQEGPAPNSNRSSVRNFADLLKLLPSDNQSKTSFHGAESVDFSEWPYPIRLQSTAMGVVLGAYTLIIVASLMGNLLVLFVIGKMRRMHRSVTNIFLLNVAVSDILITVLNIPFNLVRVLSEEWPFGSLMCSVIPFIQVAAVYSASWTMVCIAVDRLIVTVYPLRPRMPIHTGIALVILVWTFSILGALPYALIHQTVTAISFTTSIRLVRFRPQTHLKDPFKVAGSLGFTG
ncbi:hypothetical protein RvY_05813-2 [Ramazzottius varieornatus]|uniref:G-protein coupled receptors family 1 profile domain-containing protein n=1 Tax=Ramazzottius varieornatus TaxID=947166 RepID=A0A1D1V5B6_RAMVA|nr:hypothetical protein RvY_05813-2 [Ramazzottius varieornatus]